MITPKERIKPVTSIFPSALELDNPHAFIFVGIPANNKTEAAYCLSSAICAELISPNAIKRQMPGTHTAEAWEIAKGLAQYRAEHGGSFVLDSSLTRSSDRRRTVTFCQSIGASAVCILVSPDLPLALSRAKKRKTASFVRRLHDMHRCLIASPPSLEEGFQQIITITAS